MYYDYWKSYKMVIHPTGLSEKLRAVFSLIYSVYWILLKVIFFKWQNRFFRGALGGPVGKGWAGEGMPWENF